MNPAFLSRYNDRGLQLLTEDQINFIIKENKLNTNKISDGYHTIGELYDHRIRLFIALCEAITGWTCKEGIANNIWRTRNHSDGTEYDGWFLLGIFKEQGKQITYHLPISYWHECDFAETIIIAPEFDNHTSSDVLERLKTIFFG